MSQNKKDLISGQSAAAPIDPKDVQNVINDMIGHCSASVFKNYLPYISTGYRVKPIDDDISPEETVSFFDITKLISGEGCHGLREQSSDLRSGSAHEAGDAFRSRDPVRRTGHILRKQLADPERQSAGKTLGRQYLVGAG